MGAGCDKDGKKGLSGQRENGIRKIFEKNLKFVRFVHTVRFQCGNIVPCRSRQENRQSGGAAFSIPKTKRMRGGDGWVRR